MQPENQDIPTDTGAVSMPDTPQQVVSPDATTPTAISPTVPPISNAGKFTGLKKLGIVPVIAVAAVLVLVGGAGAYYGVVAPNKPENVWQKALENTAKGADRLVQYSKEQKDLKGAKTSGNFKVEASGVAADGSFEGKSYEKNGAYKADISAAGAKINLEMLSNIPDGAETPDLYFKLKGLSSIGGLLGSASPEISSALGSLDNQWYVVEHTLFDQLESSLTSAKEESSTAPALTSDDVIAIVEAVAKVNKEYLFTTAEDKAALKVVKSVGKEVIDGRKMHHFQVGFNKTQLKAYVTAMKDELKKTKLAETLKASGTTFEEAISFDELTKSVDGMDESDVADVWVDSSTKLLRKMRFTSEKKANNYIEFSLNYDGGSTYPFVAKLHADDGDSKGEVTLKTELDTTKNAVSLDMNADMTVDGQAVKASFKANVQENTEKVAFDKPEGAVSVYELLGPLLQGFTSGTSGLPTGSGVSPLGNFDL